MLHHIAGILFRIAGPLSSYQYRVCLLEFDRGCWFCRSSLPHSRAWDLGVSNLSRHIVAIDVRLLQEHVKATLILRQRMAGDLVDETLQPVPAVLDEVLIEEAVVAAKRHLAFPRFAGQRRYDNLWVRGTLCQSDRALRRPRVGLTLLSRSSSFRSHSKSL